VPGQGAGIAIGHAEHMDTNIEIRHDEEHSRFDLFVDGRAAGVLEYQLDGTVATMFHTEVFGEFGGRGLGTVLVREALGVARSRGWSIVPACWFVRDYIRAHEADADLVAATPS
jgi:predicted GNAT family acetyltransferase